MKILVFLLFSLLLIGCKGDITSSKEFLFDPQDIPSLSLENIAYFWQSDTIIEDLNPNHFYNEYDGFQEGIKLRGDHKFLEIDVFTSREIALNAIEEFRQVISMYTIKSSDHSIIKEKWWHMPNSFNTIFVNKYNTFIVVHYSLECEEHFTQNVAAEIIKRIEIISQ